MATREARPAGAKATVGPKSIVNLGSESAIRKSMPPAKGNTRAAGVKGLSGVNAA